MSPLLHVPRMYTPNDQIAVITMPLNTHIMSLSLHAARMYTPNDQITTITTATEYPHHVTVATCCTYVYTKRPNYYHYYCHWIPTSCHCRYMLHVCIHQTTKLLPLLPPLDTHMNVAARCMCVYTKRPELLPLPLPLNTVATCWTCVYTTCEAVSTHAQHVATVFSDSGNRSNWNTSTEYPHECRYMLHVRKHQTTELLSLPCHGILTSLSLHVARA